MGLSQTFVLTPVPLAGRYRLFSLASAGTVRDNPSRLAARADDAPPAFVLRRCMPWAQGSAAGLVLVAFGKSLDAFKAQLRHMAGLDAGVSDARFATSKPVTGAFFWCPPMRDGRLDLRWIGL